MAHGNRATAEDDLDAERAQKRLRAASQGRRKQEDL
jgi:hypothetical protein